MYIYICLIIEFSLFSGVFKKVKDTVFVIIWNINNWFQHSKAKQNQQWKKKKTRKKVFCIVTYTFYMYIFYYTNVDDLLQPEKDASKPMMFTSRYWMHSNF